MNKEQINKKNLIICTILIIIIILFSSIKLINVYKVKKAKKIVELKTTEVEVYSDIKLKDLISNINGKIINNKKIDTKKLGKQEITFKYINNDNIKINYTITINIVDKTPPIISQIKNYRITEGDTTDISKTLFCGDNYDKNPKCTIKGEYDVNTPGTYNVTFVGVDSSNNKSINKMNIIVEKKKEKEPVKNNQSKEQVYTDYKDVIKNYKTSDNEIGIDVSHWQGNINYKRVKKSGVEFVYIRVGRGDGIGEGYVLDDKFIKNIKGFNKVGIPVGVYFYSNANNKNDAIKEAKWVIKQIKKYDVSLEIAFDWENWSKFQDYNLSFYSLTETANAFTETVEKAGYKGMVYSSKNYLETIWYNINSDIWLAHYTSKTDYEKEYKVWQLCNNGKVAGIEDNLVDINIRYKK